MSVPVHFDPAYDALGTVRCPLCAAVLADCECLSLPAPILDNTDIDQNGNGIETGLCCIECREETVARHTIAGWYRVGLSCEHCLEMLVEWAV
jgi:hypothetical protein